MPVAFAFLIPAILGYLVGALGLRRGRLPHKAMLVFLVFPAAGLGLCGLMLFPAVVFARENGFFLLLALVFFFILSSTLLLIFHRRSYPRQLNSIGGKNFCSSCPGANATIPNSLVANAQTILRLLPHIICLGIFIAVLWSYVRYYLGYCLWNIFGGWDARYFWNLKAKFLFRAPAEWESIFSPLLAWGHPEYPLMWPCSIAWGWYVAGNEMLLWPVLLGIFFMLSLCMLIVWYLGSYTSWISGWLAGAFFLSVNTYRFWSTTQYADLPLTFFMTAAGVFLVLGARHKELPLFLISGMFTGFAIWTKDEGIFFGVWMMLTLAIYLLRNTASLHARRWVILLLFGGCLAGPLLASFLIKYVLCSSGGPYLRSGREISDFWQLMFGSWEKTRFIALCFMLFFIHALHWNGLWILFSMACVLGGRRIFEEYRWMFLLLVFLILTGYFVILHVSPHELRWQIETALLRIISHAGPLALIFTFETLSFASRPKTPN